MLNGSIINPVFLSNQLEGLADHLRDRLFRNDSSPFIGRCVLVPGEKLKTWLLHRFARDEKLAIAAGFRISTLSQGIQYLLGNRRNRIPTHLELSLQIEVEILELIEHQEIYPDSGALFDYLQGTVNEKLRKRIVHLADRIARIFLIYGIDGEGFLEDWTKKKGWQQTLWKRVFDSGQFPWSYPAKVLKEPCFRKDEIHLFGFGYVPNVYVQFFKNLNSSFYLLSPCQAFWSDLCSERERVLWQRSLKKRGIRESERRELEGYLKNQNTLLANMGKLGRRFLNTFEEESFVFEESYHEPVGESLLEMIQKDLLILSCPLDERKQPCILKDDPSIQVHGCPSKLREVEVLKENIFAAMKREGGTDPLLPKDILILAPDIAEYVPYIHRVFGDEEAPLNYAIFDLELQAESPFVGAFQHLLEMPGHRFDVESVFKLFSSSLLLEKFDFSEEEGVLIREWIQKARVYWGVDSDQRNAFLSEECDGANEGMLEEGPVGTWEHAWDLLLKQLAMVVPPSHFRDNPEVEWTEAEVLGKWIHIIQSLSEDLKPLCSRTQMPLDAWMRYFKDLAERYFCLKEEDYEILEEFDRTSQQCDHLKTPFPYLSLKRVLDQILKRKNCSFHASYLNAVKCGSLEAGCGLPAKMICLMGMQEGAFPRIEQKDSLCEKKENESPSQTEEDRYLFLEILLSARRYLILSFQSVCPRDNLPQNPSLAIQELLSYVDRNGMDASRLIRQHPSLSFDKSYFLKDSLLKSTSASYFSAAKAHFSSNKKNPPPFIPEFYQKINLNPQDTVEDCIIPINQLKKCAKNPLQFYFNHTLGIYLERQSVDPQNKEFVLSYMDKAILRNGSLKMPLENILQAAHQEGGLPLGAFKHVAHQRIQKDVEELHANLEALNVRPSEIFSVELKMTCQRPIRSRAGQWIFPALKIPLKNGRIASIIGKLEGLSPQGMLVHKSQDLEHLCEIWPLLLVMLNLSELDLPHCLLFSEGAKRKECHFENSSLLLEKCIAYYELCGQYVSPFLPRWAKSLLCGGPEAFEKEIEKPLDFELFPDPYLQWLFSRDPRPDSRMVFENWQGVLKEAFSELILFSGEKDAAL